MALRGGLPADGAGGDLESSIELLRRAKVGDHEARNRLFARYLPVLRRWATGRLPARARDLLNTDDLVQECLLRTIQRLDAFEPRHDGALLAYMRHVLANLVLEEIRRLRRRPAVEGLGGEVVDDAPSPLEREVGRENVERYEAALARLRPDDCMAIVLRVEFDYDYAALARVLGKPTANAARVAVMRALMRLGREIDRA